MKKIKNNHDNQLTYSFINKPNKRLITRRPYESLNTVTTRIEIKKKKGNKQDKTNRTSG